jgi:hypothetical protein
MKNYRSTLLLACLPMFATAVHGEELQYTNVIDKAMKCDNPNGNEIIERVHLTAPDGKVFEKDSLKLITEPKTRSFTDAAGPSGCFLENLDWKTTNILTKLGHTIPISLLVGFDVRAHADCGSGEVRTFAHIANSENVTVACSVRVNAYDTSDLK